MAGLISVISFDNIWKVGKYIYYGLLASQNRGQDNYIATLGDGVKLSISEGDFNPHHANGPFSEASGHVGMGGIYGLGEIYERKHAYASHNGHEVAIIIDGVISGSTYELARELCKLVSSGHKLDEAFLEIVNRYHGAYSLISMSNSAEVIAYRAPPGIKPLHVGGYGFDLAIISSESAPISILGGDLRRAINPGELIYLTQDEVRMVRTFDGKPTLCAFEYIYTARHDSILDGIDVYYIRSSLGAKLASRFSYDVDVVVGVPETAMPYAIGFAKALGKDIELGFVSTGSRIRTATKEDPKERLIGIQLKLNPIKYVFSGKRVAIVDDSLVRGLTMKNVVQILRNKVGVKEVHVVVGSPKLKFRCPYGVSIPSSEELLAANLDDELGVKYIEADSITWLSVDDVVDVFSRYGVNLCLGCFLGKYPVGCST